MSDVSRKITILANHIKSRLSQGTDKMDAPCFDECWAVYGSGVTIRALQKADIAKHYVAVSVNGLIAGTSVIGSAEHKLVKTPLFKPANDNEKPPFLSSLYYEAKAWPLLIAAAKENPNKTFLFWN